MEKKRTTSLLSIGLSAVAVIIVITVMSLIPVRPVQAKEPNVPAKSEPMRKCEMGEMGDMSKYMAGCIKKCQANMEDISAAKAAIKAAIEAIDKGDTKTAKIEMEKADRLMASVHKCMKENMQQMPCCNAKCPISGKPIDRMNCPKELTCMYKDMKIGFCCSNCPPEWNKLTDAEKDAKLKESMPSEK